MMHVIFVTAAVLSAIRPYEAKKGDASTRVCVRYLPPTVPQGLLNQLATARQAFRENVNAAAAWAVGSTALSCVDPTLNVTIAEIYVKSLRSNEAAVDVNASITRGGAAVISFHEESTVRGDAVASAYNQIASSVAFDLACWLQSHRTRR